MSWGFMDAKAREAVVRSMAALMPGDEIARILKTDVAAVQAVADRIGVSFCPPAEPTPSVAAPVAALEAEPPAPRANRQRGGAIGQLDWNDPAIVARLRELHGEGLSTSQIAQRLNREYGTTLTRNAIIGALHRKLPELKGPPRRNPNRVPRPPNAKPTRPDVVRKARQSAPYQAPTPKPKPTRPAVLSKPEPLRVAFMDIRDGQCKWPHGDPRESMETFFFCGHPTAGIVTPYCGFHSRLACSNARAGDWSTIGDGAGT